MSKLSQRVLILNKNWTPISVATVRRTMVLLYESDARVVDPETYETFDFEAWARKSSLEPIKNDSIITPRFHILRPEIIILTEFSGVQKRKVRLTRKNLCKRDDYTCQYCQKRLSDKLISVDHVIPRARGGRTSFTNCVIACIKCNTKKSDKTPEQVGMKLAKLPVKPEWSPFDDIETSPESWKKFIS